MNEILLSSQNMPVLYSGDYIVASDPFVHADRTLDFDILIYVTSGCIQVIEENIEYQICAGDVLFLKSGKHHYGTKEILKGTSWYYLHFHSSLSGSDEHSKDVLALPKFFHLTPDSTCSQKIAKFIEGIHSQEKETIWRRNAMLFDLLTTIAFYQKELLKQEPKLCDKIASYLESIYQEPFSAIKLENQFHLSYKHLAAVFKKGKGTTMQAYHSGVQMDEACKLLKSSSLSIGEIASSLGYSDPLYFSRCFHKQYGESPTDYRKAIPYRY